MKELTQWWQDINGESARWLILGKGPTFDRRSEYDLAGFRTIALNHAVREMPVDVVSVIDIDVVQDCGSDILRNVQYLLMPRYPHVNCKPTAQNLESFFDSIPALKQLDQEQRLVWYNFEPSQTIGQSPRVSASNFNAEVVVKIISMLGGRYIRTLGVDGGTNYAKSFNNLNDSTRLKNTQPSFDLQFAGISRAIKQFDLNFAPLTTGPMRVYVGTDESQLLGAKVLEYSIRKHSSISYEFDTMLHVKAPMPKEKQNQPRTGFSFNRFAIPALAGYQGRAVYMDADMLVLHDMRELWEHPFEGATVLHCASSDSSRIKQFSVLLLDCGRLKWDLEEIVQGLDAGEYTYDELMKEFCIEPEEFVRGDISSNWNSLEKYVPKETRLIHFTDMPTQPWVSRRNANGNLWELYLREAIQEGFISIEEVRRAVAEGFARPSLLYHLKIPSRFTATFDKSLARVVDYKFVPHGKLQSRLAG